MKRDQVSSTAITISGLENTFRFAWKSCQISYGEQNTNCEEIMKIHELNKQHSLSAALLIFI
jgi:hypothetical protein